MQTDPPPYQAFYHAPHVGLIVAVFVFSTVACLVALGVEFAAADARFRRLGKWVATSGVILSIAVSIAVVESDRRETDAMVRSSALSSCRKEGLRYEGYGEAREDARWAVWLALLPTVLVGYTGARARRRGEAWSAVILGTSPCLALAGMVYVRLQPLPGRDLGYEQCEEYIMRDAILGAQPAELHDKCRPLWLGYFSNAEEAAGRRPLWLPPETLAELTRRCTLNELQERDRSEPFRLWELARSPILDDKSRPVVTAMLDDIDVQRDDRSCSPRGLCVGSVPPAHLHGLPAGDAIAARASVRELVRAFSMCDPAGYYPRTTFTLSGHLAADGSLRDARVDGYEGTPVDRMRLFDLCANEALKDWVSPGAGAETDLRYGLWLEGGRDGGR